MHKWTFELLVVGLATDTVKDLEPSTGLAWSGKMSEAMRT